MKIETALPTNASEIATIHIKSWIDTYSGIISNNYLKNLNHTKKTKIWEKNLIHNFSRTFIASKNKQILAFASCGKNREKNEFIGELYALYVTKNKQFKGIGKALFKKTINYFIKNNINSMVVWVLKENTSKKFYERMGGTYFSEKTIKIGNQKLTEVCYSWNNLKELSKNSSTLK